MQLLKHLNMEDVKNRQWTIVACSAKSQEGLEDGLTWIIEQVKK
jgi:ADP-ribosylation factor-like protein 3